MFKKMKRNVIITIIVLVLISLLLHFYMKTDSYRIYMALCEAKENKKQIKDALCFFERGSERWKAMRYLVMHMPSHTSYVNKGMVQTEIRDIEAISSNYIEKNVNEAYVIWKNCLWKHEVSFEKFCKYILPYKVDREPIVEWRMYFYHKYKHLIDSVAKEEEAYRIIYKYIKKNFKVKHTKSFGELDVLTLDSIQGGNCRERALYMTYVMRALGIAAVMDFTPFWANQGVNGHFWTSMVRSDNITYTISDNGEAYIDGTCEPYKYVVNKNEYLYHVDSLKRIAKVYRYSYDKVRDVSVEVAQNLPDIFRCAYSVDVTPQYRNVTKNNIIPIERKCEDPLYVCTYQQQYGWRPIGRANRVDCGHVDVGPMIHDNVIVVAQYEDGIVIPRSNPYLISHDKVPEEIKPKTSKRCFVRLYRKYLLNSRWTNRWGDMIGTQIETSNDELFEHNIVSLENIKNMPIEKITIKLDAKKIKRFLRLLPAKGHYPVPAEIDLLTNDGKIINKSDYRLYAIGNGLTGDTIPLKWLRDNDPTTTFYKQFPFWIGVELTKCRKKVSYFQILMWNDCNRVTPGHEYELFYFDKGWISLGKKQAENEWIDYDDVPYNSLLLLRDYTKGREERVFVMEGKKQVWW